MNEDDIALLRTCGHVLFGTRWQTELGRALGHVDGSLMRQCCAGARPVPRSVWRHLVRLLRDRASSVDYAIGAVELRYLMSYEEGASDNGAANVGG